MLSLETTPKDRPCVQAPGCTLTSKKLLESSHVGEGDLALTLHFEVKGLNFG